MKLNIGDKVKLKNPDKFASFELDAINGREIINIMTVTNQSVADDYSILVSNFF